MTEISSTQNLNAHYSDKKKVARPENFVVDAPNSVPTNKIYDDVSANKRMKSICNDIYQGAKKEQKRDSNNFVKYCGLGLAGVLGFLGIKKLFK